MTTEEFLSHLRHLGINLWLDGEALRYSAPKEALTQELRAELLEHKAEIIASLRVTHSTALAPQSDTPSSEPGTLFVAPRTPTEDKIATIWANVLDVEQVSIHDNFFELGGDSVVSMQIVARASQLGLWMAPWQIFEHQTIAALALALDTAQSGPASKAEWEFFIPIQHSLGPDSPPSLHPTRIIEDGAPLQKPVLAPLSFTQELLWFFEQLIPGGPDSIIMFPHLDGHFDAATLEQSLNQVVQRQQALRTVFTTVDGHPMQVIPLAENRSLLLIDLSHLSRNAQTAEVERLLSVEAEHRFDLTAGPLFRSSLLRLDETSHILLLNAHHIIFDGWSRGILIDEILTLYRSFSTGDPPLLPELPIQYADYARWQREALRGEVLEKQISYWRRQLKNAPVVLDLPTDRPRPTIPTFRGARHPVKLSATLSHALRTLSQREGVSLFMTLLAAFKVLLHRYTGADNIGIGTYVANRDRRELERLIGLLITPLPLYSDLGGNPTFRELLGRVRKVTLEAYIHREIPPEVLLNELLPPQERRQIAPLFQVMLIFQNMPTSTKESLGQLAKLADLDIEHRGYADSDLALSLLETNEGPLVGSMEYSTDLFNADTISRMLDHFQTLLESIVSNPEHKVSELTLLTPAERKQLDKWSVTGRNYAQNLSIVDLFQQQVDKTPEKVSVVGQEKLTFRQLDDRTSQLASLLRRLGDDIKSGGLEGLVGLLLDPDPHVATGMLGVLKSGYGFVPIDPAYPLERKNYILADCNIRTLVTEAKHVQNARQLAEQNPLLEHIVYLDEVKDAHKGKEYVYDCRDLAKKSKGEKALIEQKQLAYVVYTSGSTGLPKGVPITHQNLIPLLLWSREYLNLGEHTKALQSLSYCFDFGIFEVLTTILFGGTLYFLDRDEFADVARYARYVNQQEINTINSTPSFFQMLTTLDIKLETLELLHLGGEELTSSTLDEIFGMVGEKCVVYNGYGPTEATINCSIFQVGTRSSRQYTAAHSAPIGQVSANNQLYVLDKNCQLVPVGVPGELHVAGAGLTPGYLNHPELTAEKFIPNPFPPFHPPQWGGQRGGERLYKTGDLVRYLPDGNIEFLGRLDYQVKIRGFRVELGEIEAVLGRQPYVKEAIVLAKGDGPDEKHLVAYVVPSYASEELSTENLRDELRSQLPDYMLPSTFVSLDALPLTSTGKINRRALLEYDTSRIEPEKEFAAPETLLEKKLVAIWTKVLGAEQIGVYDSFFDLGGHSLKATRIMYLINQAFPINLPLRTLFEEPTVAGLALRVEEALLDMLEERVKKRACETDETFDGDRA